MLPARKHRLAAPVLSVVAPRPAGPVVTLMLTLTRPACRITCTMRLRRA